MHQRKLQPQSTITCKFHHALDTPPSACRSEEPGRNHSARSAQLPPAQELCPDPKGPSEEKRKTMTLERPDSAGAAGTSLALEPQEARPRAVASQHLPSFAPQDFSWLCQTIAHQRSGQTSLDRVEAASSSSLANTRPAGQQRAQRLSISKPLGNLRPQEAREKASLPPTNTKPGDIQIKGSPMLLNSVKTSPAQGRDQACCAQPAQATCDGQGTT